MTLSLTLEIDDTVAHQYIQDAALAIGVSGVTDEEAVAKLKDAVRVQLRTLVTNGKAIRERRAAEAAAAAQLAATVTVT